MLNLMMISPRPGFLLGPDKKAIHTDDLAALTHSPVDKVQNCLKELKQRRVYSVDNSGRIYCRRMVRDHKLYEMGKKSGKKSAENRERNQDGTFKPWIGPGSTPGTRIKNKEYNYKGSDRSGDEGKPKKKSAREWTLEERREYAWKKVAEAIGPNGWEVVSKAARGNTQAIAACRAVAKNIKVRWYLGGAPDESTWES